MLVFNAALAACEAAGQLDGALGLLREMRALGVPRDVYTYSSLLGCCTAAGAGVQPALALYHQMQEVGLSPNNCEGRRMLCMMGPRGLPHRCHPLPLPAHGPGPALAASRCPLPHMQQGINPPPGALQLWSTPCSARARPLATWTPP
jgi:pentatricopeptide repeat protein